MTELAKRAVACPGWRWMPGMLATDGVSLACRVYNDGLVLRWATNIPDWPLHSVDGNEDFLPDLTDPATLGCLLAPVAQAHGVSLDDVHVVRTTGRVWSVWVFRPDDSSYRVATHEPSRAAALVAALEAAP